jgi:hypothetical protein
MPTQHLFFLLASEIPDFYRSIISTRCELFIIRRKGNGTDGFPMSGEGFKVVDRGRVVFQNSTLIAREEKEA